MKYGASAPALARLVSSKSVIGSIKTFFFESRGAPGILGALAYETNGFLALRKPRSPSAPCCLLAQPLPRFCIHSTLVLGFVGCEAAGSVSFLHGSGNRG